MKSTLRILGIIGVQAMATLLLARVARMTGSLSGVGVSVVAVLAYGVPALLAFAASFWFVIAARSRVFVRMVAAATLAFCGQIAGIAILQGSDVWLTWRYIYQVRAQLHADSRFRDVRLVCYSADYILFPYIPVFGDVATEADRRALARLLRASHPPAEVSTVSVRVGGVLPSIEDFSSRARED